MRCTMSVRRLVTACLLLSACGSGGSGAGDGSSSPCPTPPVVIDTSELPSDLPVADLTDVVEIRVRKGFLAAQAVTNLSVVELYPQLSRALLDNGYDIISGDNEGFEAEIFFRRGRGTTGTYLLREGPCEGQVTLRLLYGAKRYRNAG